MGVRVSTTSVVIRRDGRLHASVENMTPEDAVRWVEAGYHVFQVGAKGPLWVMRHVNSDRIASSGQPAGQRETADAEFLLEDKGGKDG